MAVKFQKGDKVKVVKSQLYTFGRQGVVLHVFGTSISVEIDGIGLYKYHPNSLQLIDRTLPEGVACSTRFNDDDSDNKGENNMLMGNYRVCKVKFFEGTNVNKEYTYAFYDDSIMVDDKVVVKSANHGFGLATVTQIIDDNCVTQSMKDCCNEGREIVAKFDISAYNERIEKRKAAKQLKTEMNKKLKEVQELAMFEMMAEKNPELKEMLETYKELIK